MILRIMYIIIAILVVGILSAWISGVGEYFCVSVMWIFGVILIKLVYDSEVDSDRF